MTSDQNYNTCSAAPRYNRLQRLVRWLFPRRQQTPTAHLQQRYQHAIKSMTVVHFSFSDRLRVMFGGVMTVEIISGTEHEAGESEAVCSLQILHPSVEPSLRKAKK